MRDTPREIDPSEMGRTTKPVKNIKISINWRWENMIALLGILLIQGALLPSHFNGHFPHWSMPALIFLGLCCYMVKAFKDDDWVYKLSNGIGMVLNGSMLFRIFLA